MGSARSVSRDGVGYTAQVPATIRELDVAFELSAARDALARLNDVSGRASRAAVGALLGVECLASAQLVRLVGGQAVTPGPGADRLLDRFERACAAGVRADRLDAAQVLAAHRRIVPGGGAVRTGPVWVGASDPNDAVFVGPPADQVERLLADLAGFLGRDDLCPVVQAGIGYAQLQFVHPFRDGNGRVGRWLLQVLPRRHRVAGRVCPPMGLYFVANADLFVAAHGAFRNGDIQAWCEFFGDAVVRCAAAAEQVLSGQSR